MHSLRQAWYFGSALVPFNAGSTSFANAGLDTEEVVTTAAAVAQVVLRKDRRFIGLAFPFAERDNPESTIKATDRVRRIEESFILVI